MASVSSGIAPPDLWTAAARGDVETVEALLYCSTTDVEETFQGWTPLMKAAEEDRVPIVELLLQKSANIDAVNHTGRTALSLAAAPSKKRPTSSATMHILLKARASITVQDNKGLTPLQRARREARADAVDILELQYS